MAMADHSKLSGRELLQAMVRGEVRATGQIISSGRRIVVAEARLVDVAERLLAFGTSTLLLTTV